MFETSGQKTQDEKNQLECVKKLREFINHSQNSNSKFPKSYYTTFLASEITSKEINKEITNEEYLKLADQAIKFDDENNLAEPFSTIANGLIQRDLFLDAEKYARLGLEKLEDKLTKNRQNIKINQVRLGFDEKYGRSRLLNALGNSLFKQKKIDEAEKLLIESIATFKEYNTSYNILGEIYESRNDFDKAESFYIDNLISNPLYNETEKPNIDHFKNLFQKRNGNLNDFENYLQNVWNIEKNRRKALIIADTDKTDKTLPELSFKTIDEKNISFSNLKGKVIIINIWATWCGPCVKELPQLQELSKKYANSKDVIILTLNNNENANIISKFMKKNNYDFPVLLSGNYFSEVKIVGLQTTWFSDKQGKIIYTKINYSKNLLEEFDWRIQELLK